MKLVLFSDRAKVAEVDRCVMTQFLQKFADCLPPAATALLTERDLGWEPYCEALAGQFRSPEGFGAPLLKALREIEALALPENKTLFEEALSRVPDGWINRNRPALHQCVHLWMMVEAKSTPGLLFPLCNGSSNGEANGSAGGKVEATAIEGLLSPSPSAPEEERGARGAGGEASGGGLVEVQSAAGKVPDGEGKGETADCGTAAAPAGGDTPSPPNISEPGATVERLARLSQVEYEMVRHGEAKRLKLRVRALDQAVDEARSLQEDAEAHKFQLPQLEPWPEPILDAPALFDQVHDRFALYLHLPAGAAVVLTLWCGHAEGLSAFTLSPRLHITSDEPGCGKSTTLGLLESMISNVLRTDNLKPAVLFRVVELLRPVLLLDELDTYLHLFPELRGLLNAGHSDSARVFRCEGCRVRSFRAYAAAALAGLGDVAPTLHDRSIVINLRKAPAGAILQRFDKRHLKVETELGRKMVRWVKDNLAAIAACDPKLPAAAYNRLGENWRPLFAMAQTIGGHWPQRALEAFEAMTGPAGEREATASATAGAESRDESLGGQLLSDVRLIFERSGAQRLFTSALVESLRSLPGRAWSSDANGAKPLDGARLARYLSGFGIGPRIIRIGGRQSRGYELADFAAAFERLESGDCVI